jgi:hypothetical protein
MRCAAACSSRDPAMSARETIRCQRCGDVIGVYEPMVLLLGDEALVTSGAVADQLPTPARRLHATCFGLLDGNPGPTLQGAPPRESVVPDGA